MKHQLSQPVSADGGPGRITDHRDLKRLDRTRRLPPRQGGLPRPPRRLLLRGVPDLAVRAERRAASYGDDGLCPDRTFHATPGKGLTAGIRETGTCDRKAQAP